MGFRVNVQPGDAEQVRSGRRRCDRLAANVSRTFEQPWHRGLDYPRDRQAAGGGGHRPSCRVRHRRESVEPAGAAHTNGRLHAELRRSSGYPLIVIDKSTPCPSKTKPPTCRTNESPPATNAPRHRASNKPFGRWGETSGDDTMDATDDGRNQKAVLGSTQQHRAVADDRAAHTDCAEPGIRQSRG